MGYMCIIQEIFCPKETHDPFGKTMLRELAVHLFFAKTQRLAQKYTQKLGLMLRTFVD